jgi:Zn-dependent protease
VTTPATRKPRSIRGPSPIFLVILAITIGSGWVLWNRLWSEGVFTFIFVTFAWIVTLCLHEFMHAFIAFRNGDSSVLYRGYLTLDPLRYTHVVYSLILPIIFLMVGGIGLPGGAVFVDRSALRTRFARSAVSIAGPLTNVAVAILLAVAIALRPDNRGFWAALSFLLFLQVTAALLNLLPIPGLDGYGFLEPYLPPTWARQASAIAPFAIFGLFALLWIPAINRAFFGLIDGIVQLLGVPPLGVSVGYDLYTFWN